MVYFNRLSLALFYLILVYLTYSLIFMLINLLRQFCSAVHKIAAGKELFTSVSSAKSSSDAETCL